MAKSFLRIELQTMDFKECYPINYQVYRFGKVFYSSFNIFQWTGETFSILYISTRALREEETSSFTILNQ